MEYDKKVSYINSYGNEDEISIKYVHSYDSFIFIKVKHFSDVYQIALIKEFEIEKQKNWIVTIALGHGRGELFSLRVYDNIRNYDLCKRLSIMEDMPADKEVIYVALTYLIKE